MMNNLLAYTGQVIVDELREFGLAQPAGGAPQNISQAIVGALLGLFGWVNH
jgi:hypothetical protein